jgi:hypothetical protein
MDKEFLLNMASALQALATKEGGLHTKAPSNFHTGTLLQQPGGMFSTVGIDQNVISTHVAPMGLGARLPAIPSNIDDPRFGFLTGFGDELGVEATYPCDDAPKGYMKAGNLTATFGRVMRQTETIEIDKILHQKRGASTDLRLMGTIIGDGAGLPMASMSESDILNNVVKAEMITVGVLMERKLSKLAWQGVITNNTAGGGYKEFPGLDSQIATGHKDADTNTAIPAADSYIDNFGFNLVDDDDPDIVTRISAMEYYLYNRAQRMGMAPVTWVIVLRPELWAELSAVWPCRYLTNRCSNSAGDNPVVINDDGNVRMRDDMRNGLYIDINGRRYPIVLDDGIYENTNVTSASVPSGQFASSLYFVPLRIRGSFPTLYWEHIDYRGVSQVVSPLGQGARNVPFWTDNGRFLWVYRENGYCFDIQCKVEPRLVLRTPHLAGKIQNIRYSPLNHLISPYPESPYFKNGGLSVRGGATNYSVWGNTTV